MPSLGYFFHQFASEMLSKPSKATILIDLQEELGQLKQSANSDIEMRGDSKGFETHDDLFGALNDELSKAFTGLLK